MATPVLNSIDWTIVAAALELPLSGQALPAQTRCPLCHGRLYIYQDSTFGGGWHHCNDCESDGDMVELLSRAWDMSPGSAVRKLASLGYDVDPDCTTDHEIAKYSREQLEYRARFGKMWEEAQTLLRREPTPATNLLLRALKLNFTGGSERWQSGPGILMGAIPYWKVEKTYMPVATRPIGNGKPENNSSYRVFKGRRWQEVLVIPYNDMPNRPRAFMFIGRRASMAQDVVFRKMSNAKARCCSTEAGLGYMNALSIPCDDGPVVATNNWLLALQLHVRAFNASLRAIPLVAWRDDGKMVTRDSWNAVPGKKVVIWQPGQLDAKTVRQAVMCDADLSLAGPRQMDEPTIRHYVRLHPATDLLRLIRKLAKPWPEALKGWLDNSRDGQVEQLISDLEYLGEDVSYILRSCGTTTSRTAAAPQLFINIEGHKVVEKGGRWIDIGNKSRKLNLPICDAPFRITHVIKDRAVGKLYYKGEITYKRQTIPFLDDADTVDDRTDVWLRDKVAHIGLPLLRPNWGKLLRNISVKLHEPEPVKGTSMIGWDPVDGIFRFKNFCILTSGGARPNSEHVPARMEQGDISLDAPDSDWPSKMEKTGNPALDAVNLAMLSLVASNIIAPAFGRSPIGIILAGNAARACEQWASSINCRRCKVPLSGEMDTVMAIENETGWPVLYRRQTGVSRQKMNELLAADGPRNCIVTTDPLSAACRAANGGWATVQFRETPDEEKLAAMVVTPTLVTSYIRDFVSRGMPLARESRSLWRAVLSDMFTRLKQRAVDDLDGEKYLRSVVFDLDSYVTPWHNEMVALAFLGLVGWLCQGGRLKLQSDVEKQNRPNMLHINKSAFTNLLIEQHVAPPNKDAISRSLKEAKWLEDETPGRWSISDSTMAQHLPRALNLLQIPKYTKTL